MTFHYMCSDSRLHFSTAQCCQCCCRSEGLRNAALITVVITVAETEEEEEEEAVAAAAPMLLLKKRACGWNGRAAGKPMMGDLMAMPMGTGPSRDDLLEAAKN